MSPRRILIAGASGLVGFAAAKHFATRPGWRVPGVSRRLPAGLPGVELISIDLTDQVRCAEVFGAMRDVTHVVYAALYEKPGLIRGWRERDQMETNERMLRKRYSDPITDDEFQLLYAGQSTGQPGQVATPATSDRITPEAEATARKTIPLRRSGRPEPEAQPARPITGSHRTQTRPPGTRRVST